MAKKSNSSGNKSVDYQQIVDADFVTLVDIVRRSTNREKSDAAFNEIEKRMQPKIKQISYKFNIPGHSFSDLYQESLYALRYKAIKDYNKDRGDDTGPYPFDKFAVLCIRRHLSTKLKASYQNKKKVLNGSASLDQNRNESSAETLFLADIVPDKGGPILEEIEKNEYYKSLFSNLFNCLSNFEQDVFLLYIQRYSYEQIAEKINNSRRKNKSKINVKSIDNALSRIKIKAKDIDH